MTRSADPGGPRAPRRFPVERGPGRHRAGLLLAAALGACAPADEGVVVLASTTSTDDSGLLDVLVPAFEATHPWRVRVLAVGSGQALELGRRGDADVLLVHEPAAESTFLAQGHASERRPVMANDFVLLGPPADPAGVRGLRDAAAALRRIAEAEAPFLSRGDDSGTHAKERALWADALSADGAAGPSGPWYREAGQGMGEVLAMAAEMRAYALSDRGTYLALGPSALEVLVEGDPRLLNPYGVLPVARAPNPAGAVAFVEWITSPEAQRLIADFGAERFGQPLFLPADHPTRQRNAG